MERFTRMLLVGTGCGLAGVLFGAITGIFVGIVMGLIFGNVMDSIAVAVFFGAVIDGIAFALTGIAWDNGPGTDLFGGRSTMNKPTVLFLCTNNAVRSQMAEAFLKQKAADQFDTHSAGTEPKESIR